MYHRPNWQRLWPLLLCCTSLAWTQERYPEIFLAGVKGSHSAEASVEVLTEAYRSIGRTLRVRWETGQDGLELAARGKGHGVLQRIDGLANQIPTLKQVQIPVNVLQVKGFTWRPPFDITSWNDLKPHKIGIVSRTLYAENGTQGMNVTRLITFEELFRALDERQVDIAICPLANGFHQIVQQRDLRVKPTGGIIETLLLYHYLHEDHADLAAAVAVPLKQFLTTGRTRVIREELVRRLKRNSEE